jgi:hypothetical protein
LRVAAPDDRDPPPDEPSPAEPRARDIASAKSTAELEEKLDPETIAQLASWFGLPSFEQIEEEQRQAAPAEDAEFAAKRERMAKASAAVEPAMVELLERHRPRGDRMLGDRLPPPMEVRIREIARVDASMIDQLAQIAEPRDVQRPHWIDEACKEGAPQAILRDLHRPESTFTLGYPLPDPEPGLSELTGDIRAVTARSYKVRPNLTPSVVHMRDALAELHHWKRVPWGTLTKRSETPDAATGAGSPDDRGKDRG